MSSAKWRPFCLGLNELRILQAYNWRHICIWYDVFVDSKFSHDKIIVNLQSSHFVVFWYIQILQGYFTETQTYI